MHDQGGNWSTWPPPPPAEPPRSILATDPSDGRNSPVKLAGVLGVVIALVLAVALLGRDDIFDGATEIAGHPVAAPGAPNAAPPGSTSAPSTGPMPRAVYRLGDNPLLADGIALPQVTCELPAMNSDAEQLRAYYEAAIGCLDQAWRPVLASVNEPFTTPRLQIEAARSMCGDAPSADEATAYYCSGGKVIFMPIDRLLDQAGQSQAAHLAVLAHEYGHHVQALSGILTAAYDKGEPFDKESPERLELTRRAELQANCFAGLFVTSVAGRGSVSTKLARAAADSFRDSIADDSHGSIKHQVKWGRAGYDSNRTAACNTWTAPAEEVS